MQRCHRTHFCLWCMFQSYMIYIFCNNHDFWATEKCTDRIFHNEICSIFMYWYKKYMIINGVTYILFEGYMWQQSLSVVMRYWEEWRKLLKLVLREWSDCIFFFYKAFKVSVLCFRCLCLAGCNIEQKNGDGIKAEITALKYGYNDICNLLSRLRNVCFLSITEFLMS